MVGVGPLLHVLWLGGCHVFQLEQCDAGQKHVIRGAPSSHQPDHGYRVTNRAASNRFAIGASGATGKLDNHRTLYHLDATSWQDDGRPFRWHPSLGVLLSMGNIMLAIVLSAWACRIRSKTNQSDHLGQAIPFALEMQAEATATACVETSYEERGDVRAYEPEPEQTMGLSAGWGSTSTVRNVQCSPSTVIAPAAESRIESPTGRYRCQLKGCIRPLGHEGNCIDNSLEPLRHHSQKLFVPGEGGPDALFSALRSEIEEREETIRDLSSDLEKWEGRMQRSDEQLASLRDELAKSQEKCRLLEDMTDKPVASAAVSSRDNAAALATVSNSTDWCLPSMSSGSQDLTKVEESYHAEIEACKATIELRDLQLLEAQRELQDAVCKIEEFKLEQAKTPKQSFSTNGNEFHMIADALPRGEPRGGSNIDPRSDLPCDALYIATIAELNEKISRLERENCKRKVSQRLVEQYFSEHSSRGIFGTGGDNASKRVVESLIKDNDRLSKKLQERNGGVKEGSSDDD